MPIPANIDPNNFLSVPVVASGGVLPSQQLKPACRGATASQPASQAPTWMIVTFMPTSHWYISDSSLPLNMQCGFMRAATMADVTAALTIWSYSVPADQSL